MKGEPLKILRVIARLNVGGPARHVIYLSERMNDASFQTLLVKGSEAEAEGSMEPLARSRGVEPHLIRELGREISPFDDLIAFFKLYRLLLREQPHILHTHTAKAGTLGRLAALLYRISSLTAKRPRLLVYHTFHGHVLRGYFGKCKSLLFRVVEGFLAASTTRVITLSAALREELVALGIAKRERIAVVPLGLELDSFLEVEGQDGGFRSELGIPASAFLVGIVGRLVPIKDHRTFFRAARNLLGGGVDAHFAVVGDGELKGELEAEVVSLGLESRVHFTGWREALPILYADLDVVALTSKNEGTPVSLIEALAARRPVVAAAVGGVPEILGKLEGGPKMSSESSGGVEEGERGLLVPPGDPLALAEAIRRVREDPEGVSRKAEAGRSFVRDRYHVDRLVHDLKRLYLSS